jgi:NodT family efflux transporter outer membrane factor (OMF) lipoprotein
MKRLLLSIAFCFSVSAHAAAIPPAWRLLNDPQLDGLIAEALAANPDVRTAAARLTLAEAEFDSTRAARRPELNLNAGGERRTYSRNDRREDSSLKSPATHLTFGAGASYEVDLWGRLAKAAEAGRAETLASAADLDAARLSIAAEVAVAWYSLRGELVEGDLITRRQSAARQQLALLEERFKAGLIGADEIAAHRSPIAQLDADQIEHTRLIAAWRNRLVALRGQSALGETPGVVISAWPELNPSASLTTELIGQRPDVRAAYARVAANQARVGSAKAARLPSLNLTADGLFSSHSLQDLLNSGSLAGWLAAQINLPLFDGGRRKARVRAAEAELSVGMADYTATTVRAFQETADALTSVETAHDRLIATQADIAARRQRLALALTRLDAGLSDRLAVLDAEISHLEAEREAARARLNQTLAGISLGRALAAGFGLAPHNVDAPQIRLAAQPLARAL